MNKLRKEETIIYDLSLTEKGEGNIEFEQKGDYEEWTSEEYSDREKEIEELEIEITELLKQKFEKFWKALNKDYEYLMGDEAIGEHLEINEREFLEDGERY